VTGEVRVMVYQSTARADAVREAYHLVSRQLRPVAGLLGNELLRSVADPAGFVAVSRWTDLAAFQEWERGAGHRDTTAPLRPFRSMPPVPPFGVYQVDAAY
jgi:heme-degrading monooxygenase HmoA